MNDRSQGRSPSAAAGTAGPDRAVPDDLVFLLSQLEHLRGQLVAMQGQKRRATVVQTATAMMDAVVTVAERWPDSGRAGEDLSKALAEAGGFYTAAQAFVRQYQGSGLRSLVNALQASTARSAERQRLFEEIIQNFCGVLEGFLTRFQSYCPSPAAAQEWSQASRVFLADLLQVIGNLDR